MAKRAKRKPGRPGDGRPSLPTEQVTNVIQLPVRAEPAAPPPPEPPPPPPPVAAPPVQERLSQDPYRPRYRGRRSSVSMEPPQPAPAPAATKPAPTPAPQPVATKPSPAAPKPAPAAPQPVAAKPASVAPQSAPAAPTATPVASAPRTPTATREPRRTTRAEARRSAEQRAAVTPRAPEPSSDTTLEVRAPQVEVTRAPEARGHVEKFYAPADSTAARPAPSAVSPSAARRAPVEHREEHDHESEAFFSSHPPPQPHYDDHDFEHTGEFDGLRRTNKRGMMVTLVILALGVLGIGSFIVYNKVLMPTPEELAPRAVALPTPDTLKDLDAQLAEAARERAEPPAAPTPAPHAGEAIEPAVAAPEVPAEAPVAEAQVAEVQVGEQAPAQVPAVEAAPVAPAPAIEPPPVAPASALEEGDAARYASLLDEARKQGFKKSAEASYLQALGVNPQGVEALSGLAMLYLNQAKNPQARDRARQALALAPNSAEAWIVLGAALDALGSRAEAREAYHKCAALPLDGDGARYVGECKRLLR